MSPASASTRPSPTPVRRRREKVADAKEQFADASGAPTAGKIADAKAAAAEQIAKVKPRMRGVSHEYAFFVSLVLGVGADPARPGRRGAPRRRDLRGQPVGLFGVSALYHRVDWQRPRRAALDAPPRPHDDLLPDRRHRHAVRAAGHGRPAGDRAADRGLVGRARRHVVELVWVDHPKWVAAVVYIGVGMIGAIGFPAIVAEAGIGAGLLIAPAARSTRPARSSTPPGALTRARRSSATTRSSTCW